MSITTDDVFAIARLGRLRINDADANHYAESLSDIMDLVAQMNAVDTRNIEPMAHPQDVNLPLREDKATENNCRDELMEIAPSAEKGLFLVPRVVE